MENTVVTQTRGRTPKAVILLAGGGDRSAQEQCVTENTGLIWSVARRFIGKGADPDDLFQLGCVGFLKALTGYDPSFGTEFSTYAVPKIAGEIRRFLRDDGAIKVSRVLKEQAAIVRASREALEQRLGREPALSEVSADTGISVEDIAAAETAVSPLESITGESGEAGATIEAFLTDYEGEDKLIELVELREAVNKLPDREKTVIGLRYFRGMTQAEAAKILRVSQVQVSRLERKALEWIRGRIS